MGRDATKACGNPWYEARKQASMYDDKSYKYLLYYEKKSLDRLEGDVEP